MIQRICLALFTLIVVFLAGILVYVKQSGPYHLDKYLTELMKTDVTVGSLDLGWNRLRFYDIVIKNPKKGRIENALTIPEVTVDLMFSSLFTHKVVITKINIHNPTLGIDCYNKDGSDNNWTTIMAAINDKSPSTEKEVEIQHLKIHPLNIYIYHPKVGKGPVMLPPIPEIDYHDIGTHNPLTYKDAYNIVIQAVLSYVAQKQGLLIILHGITKLPEDLLRSIFDPDSSGPLSDLWKGFKGLFGQ